MFFLWPIGVLWGIVFEVLCLLRIFQVKNFDHFPYPAEKIIIVANHPSVIDPFLLAGLFFGQYFWHPFKKRPAIIADKANFFDSWWFFWAQLAMIPVERGDRKKEAFCFLQVIKAIESGRPAIIFPEGGRTFKGKDDEFHYSEKRKKIRPFKGGVGLLASRTKCLIVPVWIEGSDKVVPNSKKTLWTKLSWWKLFKKGITIKIGRPIDAKDFPAKNREEITQKIVISLLKLADSDDK